MENMSYNQHGVLSEFMYRVYGWMTIGLALTGAVAYYVASVPGLVVRIVSQPALLFGLFIGQIALVLILSLFILRMSFFVAFLCFLAYAAMLGVTLSSIFLAYNITSIYITFLITAGTFGIMCIYGYFTKSDLSSIGNIATMALFGLILAMVVNLFLKSPTFDYVISGVGVILFTLLTAYDSQRIKQMAMTLWHDKQVMSKIALMGALTLYLDFINLFLFLLQFMGKRRD